MKPNSIEILAALLFALAELHTFFIKKFQHYAGLFSEDSFAANQFHLLGEVEIVFGWWADCYCRLGCARWIAVVVAGAFDPQPAPAAAVSGHSRPDGFHRQCGVDVPGLADPQRLGGLQVRAGEK